MWTYFLFVHQIVISQCKCVSLTFKQSWRDMVAQRVALLSSGYSLCAWFICSVFVRGGFLQVLWVSPTSHKQDFGSQRKDYIIINSQVFELITFKQKWMFVVINKWLFHHFLFVSWMKSYIFHLTPMAMREKKEEKENSTKKSYWLCAMSFPDTPVLLDDIFDIGTAAVCIIHRDSAHLLLINDNTC